MNGTQFIPEISFWSLLEPDCKWHQPNSENLFFCNIRVHISLEDFNKLLNEHTGKKIAGQMWKEYYDNSWWLHYWDRCKDEEDCICIERIKIRVVGAARQLIYKESEYIHEDQ